MKNAVPVAILNDGVAETYVRLKSEDDMLLS